MAESSPKLMKDTKLQIQKFTGNQAVYCQKSPPKYFIFKLQKNKEKNLARGKNALLIGTRKELCQPSLQKPCKKQEEGRVRYLSAERNKLLI